MSDLRVVQNGNRLSFDLAGKEIWIEVEGIDLPLVKDNSFALWMAPLAMQKRVAASVAMFTVAWSGYRTNRLEGTALLAGYFAYIQRIARFKRKRVKSLVKRMIAVGSTVLTDGLACFRGIADTGSDHTVIVTVSGRRAAHHPAFKWVNTILSNKGSIVGTFRAVVRGLDGRDDGDLIGSSALGAPVASGFPEADGFLDHHRALARADDPSGDGRCDVGQHPSPPR